MGLKPLSTAQERALAKLSREWRSSYELQEGRNTLDALVSKGLAESRGHNKPGAFIMPRSMIQYRSI